jgi:hypothetical protein
LMFQNDIRGCYEFRCNELEIRELHSKFDVGWV